jgi:hypothetical protein
MWKKYIPFNLYTNQDDVGAKIENGSKFDKEDEIEEHNLDDDVTIDEYTRMYFDKVILS